MAFSFTPQPQQQQPQQLQLFQPQQQSLFQQNSPFFQQQPQQRFQVQLQPQQQQFLQQPQQQPMYLFTNEKAPATYGTKWADLHPDSQKFLLQIEEKVLEYRDESQRLDQCNRLYDSSVSNEGFEPDASHIELGGVSTAMERQKVVLYELMAVVKDMLRNTEVAIRSFMMLRPRFVHPSTGAVSNATTPPELSGVPGAPSGSTQPVATSVVPIINFYSGLPKKPSPFLQQTVARFEKYLGQWHQWIEELEQLLLLDSRSNSLNSSSSLLQSLPKVMSNVHDFFVHVAAKVESIHQYIESMKTAYLVDQRGHGDASDPFIEADRRETAKQEAAARRVHPTLHLPAISQPSTQVAGLLTSSATPEALSAPHTSAAVVATLPASGSSLFGTPSAATSSSLLFSTPIVSAPKTSLFGASGTAPQTSLFGASTPLFGSTPSFGATPSGGVSTFSTPFASGAATGSGASFGTASKTRAKTRTSRR